MRTIFFIEVTVPGTTKIESSYQMDEIDLDVLPRIGDELRVSTPGAGVLTARVEKVTWDVPMGKLSPLLPQVWVLLTTLATIKHADRVLSSPSWKYMGDGT